MCDRKEGQRRRTARLLSQTTIVPSSATLTERTLAPATFTMRFNSVVARTCHLLVLAFLSKNESTSRWRACGAGTRTGPGEAAARDQVFTAATIFRLAADSCARACGDRRLWRARSPQAWTTPWVAHSHHRLDDNFFFRGFELRTAEDQVAVERQITWPPHGTSCWPLTTATGKGALPAPSRAHPLRTPLGLN